MKFLNFYKSSILLKVALGISIIAIGYLTTMFYFQMRDLNSSFNAIENANNTQVKVEKLISLLKDGEIKLHSYIITKHLSFLDDDDREKSIVENNLNDLKNKFKKNRQLSIDFNELNYLVEARYKLLGKISTLAASTENNTILLNEKIIESHQINKQIDDLLNSTLTNEISLIKYHNKTYQERLKETRNTVLLIALVSILIFLLSYNKMNDNILSLKKMNDELKIVNEIFKTSEEIAGFGHWKYNLVTKKYTFSENLFKILEVSPDSFNEDEYSILKFLHPDDVEYASNIHFESIKNKQTTSLFYRVILPNGKIKYMSAIGSFTKNGKNQDVKIGVTQDITALNKSNIELKQKNDKLLAINTELESFNNIVSHDLQEPLRKIQMFISRIEDSELTNISDKGKEYFDKIKIASKRMQNLMIDMVNYSRTIKEDKVILPIDLNKVLNEIIERINITIEEYSAEVIVHQLPTIKGTHFQVNQLFENLISNSLKYKKDHLPPKIEIFEEVKFNDVVNELADLQNGPIKNVTNKNYYKIVIKDNGIGFDPLYAQNIFQLFKRLETSNLYMGTGLGLAICKKIIENHNGYITADGQINVGSVFSIYFPK